MGETLTIKEFPVWKVDMARDMVARMTARFAKAAVKAGVEAPAVPEFTVTNVREVVVCSVKSCGSRATLEDVGKDCMSIDCVSIGYYVNKSVCDLVVTAESATLGGWEFLAVIEPMTGGNMVRRVPGSDTAFDLTAYRTGDALGCDHCNAPRHRKETFVVRSDGSALPKGTVKKVGRNCLSYFLGGKSPAAIVARLAWEKALREMGDGEGGWGGGEAKESVVGFLTTTAAVVRAKGWVSKSAAAAYNEKVETGKGKTPTVSIVRFISGRPPFDREARREWRELREECKATEKDAEKAAAVVEWAKSLTGNSDYEYNLRLVAAETFVEDKNKGLLASAVGSYDREMDKLAERKRADETKVPAPLGKGVAFEGEVIKTSAVTNDWGSTNKMTVKVTTPEGGTWFAWMSIPDHLLGKWMTVKDEAGKWTTVCAAYGTEDRDSLVGRKLSIVATLEAGKEPHFVFGKRPAVSFADVYGPKPENPKVKKPRAKKAPKTEAA